MNSLTLFFRCVINKGSKTLSYGENGKCHKMKGQESQVLNGKEAFELINVFPSLLLSLISLLF